MKKEVAVVAMVVVVVAILIHYNRSSTCPKKNKKIILAVLVEVIGRCTETKKTSEIDSIETSNPPQFFCDKGLKPPPTSNPTKIYTNIDRYMKKKQMLLKAFWQEW